jgi:hypothetical protein
MGLFSSIQDRSSQGAVRVWLNFRQCSHAQPHSHAKKLSNGFDKHFPATWASLTLVADTRCVTFGRDVRVCPTLFRC